MPAKEKTHLRSTAQQQQQQAHRQFLFTPKDFTVINNLITAGEQQTFEAITSQFTQQFSKDDYLRIGVPLSMLLYEHTLLEKAEHRVIICHLLSSMVKLDQGALAINPYMSILYPLLAQTTPPTKSELMCSLPLLTAQEKYFIASALLNRNRELLRKTPAQLMEMEPDRTPLPDLTPLKSAYVEQQARLPLTAKCSFRPALRAPANDKDPAASRLSTMEQLLTQPDAPLCEPVRPQFARLMPPLHSDENDYIWLSSGDDSWATPIWSTEDEPVQTAESSSTRSSDTPNSAAQDSPEKSVTSTTSESAESSSTAASSEQQPQEGGSTDEYDVVTSMQRALGGQLQLAESQWLIEQIKKDGNIVHRVRFTPDKLPKLVEDNPMVAVEVLLFLLPSKQITEYFEVLINMELSVHGMEVVNRLTSMVDVPEEFLNVYVTECIAACENIKDSPFTQNRLVRMVCVFLSSLIRNKLINVQDLFIELQAFCINFSAVKEAAALYQTVQMMAPQAAKLEQA